MDNIEKYIGFKEAREFARTLRLDSYYGWLKYLKNQFPSLPVKPDYITSQPHLYYKNQGWISWDDWLCPGNNPSKEEDKIDHNFSDTDKNNLNTLDSEYESEDQPIFFQAIIKPLLLDELKAKYNISTRAYNVCEELDIENSNDLVQYYFENKNFKYVRNCGRNTTKELCNVVKQIIVAYDEMKSVQIHESNSISIKNEEKIQNYENNTMVATPDWALELILDNYSISVRSENVLRDAGLVSSNKIIEYYRKYRDFRTIRHCGAKSNGELKSFVENLMKRLSESEAYQINNIQNEAQSSFSLIQTKQEGKIELLNEVVELMDYLKKYYNFSFNFSDYEDYIISFDSHNLKIFKLLRLMIQSYLSERDYKILHVRCFALGSPSQSLASLGEMFSLTRERVRQIEDKKYSRLNDKIRNFFNLNRYITKYIDKKYFISNPIKILPNDFFDLIRNDEDVDFNNEFITIILSVINKCRYVFIHENYSLVHLDTKSFDLVKFTKYIENRIKEKISKDYFLDLESVILKYYKKANNNQLQEIKPFIKHMLAETFQIFVESDDTIKFKKNDFRILPEFIEDILIEQCRPLHIIEIANILNAKYPGIVKNPNSLKRLIYDNSNILHLGRSSTYAHKSLERINLKFKAGTIRDIAFEYLKITNRRVHITELTKYVKKYRKTNEKNISGSLRMDRSKRFKILPKEYYEINK